MLAGAFILYRLFLSGAEHPVEYRVDVLQMVAEIEQRIELLA